MKLTSTSRRLFLRGAGGATAVLPFLASAPGWRQAHAQPAAAKRMIFVYLSQNETEDFMPKSGAGPLSLEGTYLAPLAPFTKKTLVLHNMLGRTGHSGAHGEWLTGFDSGEYRPTAGPSIDQLLADRLRGRVPVPSLGLTIASKSMAAREQAVMSWTKDLLPVPANHDALDAFTRVLFGGGATGQDAGADRARKLSGSLLDGLMDDYRQLQRRLATSDRRLLDAHLELLRENERKLVAAATATCDPTQATAPPKLSMPDQSEGDVPLRIGSFMDVIASAIQCDVTRVVTLGMGFSHDQTRYPFAGCSENFHLVAHRTIDDAGSRARPLHSKVRQWQAQQIAKLCARLDAVATPAGGTLLDETSVVWLPELGYRPSTQGGNTHLRNNAPAVIVGGCGGYFKTGRLVDMARRDYCDLLLTLVHAMGHEDVKAVGSKSTGPLTTLRA